MTTTDWRNKLYFGDYLDILRENVDIGLFITHDPSTGPMDQEAIAVGIYTPKHYPGHRYPRVQADYPRFAPEATLRRSGLSDVNRFRLLLQ